MPGLKQSVDFFYLVILLHRVHTDLSCELAGDTGWWNLSDGTHSVFVDAFTEFLKHFDGGADLDGGGCLHDACQIRMPREGL